MKDELNLSIKVIKAVLKFNLILIQIYVYNFSPFLVLGVCEL